MEEHVYFIDKLILQFEKTMKEGRKEVELFIPINHSEAKKKIEILFELARLLEMTCTAIYRLYNPTCEESQANNFFYDRFELVVGEDFLKGKNELNSLHISL